MLNNIFGSKKNLQQQQIPQLNQNQAPGTGGGTERGTGNNISGSISVIKEQGKEIDLTKEVASVVVTISKGSTYDSLFRNLPQESEYGRVAVYLVKPGEVFDYIKRALDNEKIENFTLLDEAQKNILSQLKKDCFEAGADAVCFNFECCSGYSSSGFGHNIKEKQLHKNLLIFLVKEFGCMTMFSDFSLKALIKDWPNKLGSNPLKEVGSFSNNLELGFDPKILEKSPSAQLNTVGSLSEGGKAKLHAMGGTILYTLTNNAQKLAKETTKLLEVEEKEQVHVLEKQYKKPYEVELLTVATMFQSLEITKAKLKEHKKNICKIGENEGLAGHVLLTFAPSKRNIEKFKADLVEEEEAKTLAIKEGKAVDEEESDTQLMRGMILTSCGHWSELMKIDVNMERLLTTVKQEWGADADNFQEMTTRYGQMDAPTQQRNAELEAVSYMNSRAPAKFNQKLMRRKKKGY